MSPSLKNGDYVVIWNTKKVKKGDVVLVQKPNSRIFVIKRVKENKNNMLDLRGDNSLQSTDSRDFGLVPIERVIGKVVWRIK